MADAVADMGRVHILINAQGFNVKAPATEFPVADWDKLFSVNVRGVMLCCKHFAKHMVEQGGGKIINLSSIRGARAALGGNLAYCASKGAIDMMTKQLAVELASKKVLVNAIAPIITITPMTEERVKREADRYEKMLVNVPMGRMGTVLDLIGPAVFLASRGVGLRHRHHPLSRRRDDGVRLARAPAGQRGPPARDSAASALHENGPWKGGFQGPFSAAVLYLVAEAAGLRCLACPRTARSRTPRCGTRSPVSSSSLAL